MFSRGRDCLQIYEILTFVQRLQTNYLKLFEICRFYSTLCNNNWKFVTGDCLYTSEIDL